MARYRATDAGTPIGPWRATRGEAADDIAAVENVLETIEDTTGALDEPLAIEEDEGDLEGDGDLNKP